MPVGTSILRYKGPMLNRLLLIAALCLTGCDAADFLNAVTSETSIQSIDSFAYGDGPRATLDLYTPASPRPGAPIVVFIHGGAWDSGDKDMYLFVAEAFTSAGYTIAAPNYRLYPDVIYPAFVEDAAKAVAWVAKRYPGTPLIIAGHSAGAHSALMLALETGFLEKQGIDRCQRIAAAIGLAGPYGAVAVTREPHISIFPERLQGDDAPLNYVSQAAPPTLLMTGLKDTRVYPKNTIALAKALAAAGASTQLITYPELDHVDMVKLLSHWFEGEAEVKTDLFAFLNAQDAAQGPFCGR